MKVARTTGFIEHAEAGLGRANVPTSARNTRLWRAMLPNYLENERTVRLQAEEHGSDSNQTKHLCSS